MKPDRSLGRGGVKAGCSILARYGVVVIAGAVLSYLHVPLAWLIGALVSVFFMTLRGLRVPIVPRSTQAAQLTMGTIVGATFDHEALSATLSLLAPMMLATVFSLIVALLATVIIARLARLDYVTGILCTLSIGPIESVHMARHYGREIAPIVFIQCSRIMAIVLIVPPLVFFFGGSGGDPGAALRVSDWSLFGLALAVALALIGAGVARIIRMPNIWFMGPCLAAVAASLCELPVSAVPYQLLVLAQLVMGINLGGALDTKAVGLGNRLVMAGFISMFFMIGISALTGLWLASMVGVTWQVGTLALMPGAIGEMALTAKMLEQSVAVVIGFHLMRVILTNVTTPIVVHLLNRFERRS